VPENAKKLMDAVRQRYAAVAREPRGQFPYPVGAESLSRLGYDARWTAGLSANAIERFVGVGNPMRVRPPRRGERVLDVGCGCGLDTLVAARLVGMLGQVVGLDASPEMLEHARSVAPLDGRAPAFVQGVFEHLPFTDESFDLVISNGALNLATDKDLSFIELARILAAGGELVVADLVVREAVPERLLASMDAWST
jgi:SAM-dependent methyltransferase